MAISTATALVGGAVLGSALIGSRSAEKAAESQSQAATQAAATQSEAAVRVAEIEREAAERAASVQAEAFRQAAAEQERGITGATGILTGAAPPPVSPDAPLTANTVNALYQQYLGRPAEQAAVNAWAATGGTATNLMDALAESEEFNLRLQQVRSQEAAGIPPPQRPSIVGGFELQAQAAQQAAAQLAQAQIEAARLQREQAERAFVAQQELLGPFREAGVNALGRIQTGIAPGGEFAQPFTTERFQADPGYAFRFAEGQKALERQAAARGGLISGAALRAATRFGQEMGSQEFQNAFNRYYAEREAQLNPLFQLYAGGLGSASELSGAAGVMGGNIANYLGAGTLGAGEALSRGTLGAAAARSTGYLEQLQAQAQAERDIATTRASAYTGPAQFQAQGILGAGRATAQGQQQSAAALGQGLLQAGQARAAGQLGVANALTGAIGTGLGYYQQQQLLNRLYPPTMGDFPDFSFG